MVSEQVSRLSFMKSLRYSNSSFYASVKTNTFSRGNARRFLKNRAHPSCLNWTLDWTLAITCYFGKKVHS